jgi:hypothetical protein
VTDDGEVLALRQTQLVDNAADQGFILGLAWMVMWIAPAIHVTDEALTAFLAVCNPTPTFESREWLMGLALYIAPGAPLAICFPQRALDQTSVLFRGCCCGIVNALGHTATTIFGQTLSTVHFPRPAPGFYSSPFLFAAAIYL